MNLHRIEGAPEWADVPADRQNIWQRIAAATAGTMTPGNIISLIGLASVPYGLWLILGHGQYLAGAIVLAIGRLCDLLDGWAADRTGTKSPLGEIIDASFDKLSLAATLISLAAGGIVPLWSVGILLLPHVIVGILAGLTFFKGGRLHPSREGKISMALVWFYLLAVVMRKAFEQSPMLESAVGIVAYVLLVASVGLGLYATRGYVLEFKSAAL